MIKLTRLPAPATLVRWAPKWTADLLTAIAQQQAGGKKPPEELWDKYNKSYVKDALQRMAHGKCVYCESNIKHVAYPHIEHYRPKRRYPEFTYTWENLLLACPVCNNDKSDAFPLDPAESPLLLNPCDDDPEEHITFARGRLVALSERGKVTRDQLSLNRDALFDERRKLLTKALSIYMLISELEKNGQIELANEWRAELEAMRSSTEEFSAMIRQAIKDNFVGHKPL
jgi:uncharacterized protein (TIGR02646 family)